MKFPYGVSDFQKIIENLQKSYAAIIQKTLGTICFTVCPLFIINRTCSIFSIVKPLSIYHQNDHCRSLALVLAAQVCG